MIALVEHNVDKLAMNLTFFSNSQILTKKSAFEICFAFSIIRNFK